MINLITVLQIALGLLLAQAISDIRFYRIANFIRRIAKRGFYIDRLQQENEEILMRLQVNEVDIAQIQKLIKTRKINNKKCKSTISF